MMKRYNYFVQVLSLLFFLSQGKVQGQSGTDFWFAPPDITDLHNTPGGEPIYLLVSSMGQAATVTISQPANASFNGGSPIVLNIAAGKSARVNLTSYKNLLETRPTNTILNTGLRIVSTTAVTTYYEIANTNNTDIFALKGPNGLGTEFYIPLHKHAPFYNHTFASPHQAYASFDIVATQNNTTVTIYSPVAVDGHPALQQFSMTLNQGQTYSCGYTGTNYEQPSTHPAGAVVLSDKPVAVTIKDDSNQNPSGGCYDLLGDQIVPVNAIGTDYIAVKGSLNATGDESVMITATRNNTKVYLNGSSTAITTLFAGEYFRVDIDSLASGSNNSIYINASQPVYALHVTGFGCEMGAALLPPLNCAGSQQVNFVRSSSESFFVTLLVRTTAVNNFAISGSGTATINPASFATVPGTGGVWRACRIQYNTTQIPVDSTFSITNSADVFAMGIINGGAASGCRYGYFSEFVAPITVSAGPNESVCANDTAQLNGSVSGGSITGIWTSNGTGAFIPNNTTLNALYIPSVADASVGTVTLTLTSTGSCTPQSAQKILTITPAPTVNAGVDQSICKNNTSVILNGSVTVASGGVWSGGSGTFSPANSSLNATYIPTAAEVSAGGVSLTLTSVGNGICNPVRDNMTITFTVIPTIDAGANKTACSNNPAVTLSGFVSGAGGGLWTGNGGSFSPGPSSLNAIYTPSVTEINNGSTKLYLTSTGNGNCNAVIDSMTITFTLPPTANAGSDITVCANNASVSLNGSVTIATGGQWTGGLGTFSTGNTTLGSIYNPTVAEINSGTITLTLTTTGNGTCSAVTDNVIINFTVAPTVVAGSDQITCANNSSVTLNGSYTIATGVVWTGGTGSYNPNNTSVNTIYTPSASEIATGSVTLTLTTTGNGTCNSVSDAITIDINASPTVNAGTDISSCANNSSTALNGQVFNATGGTWSGGSGTYNPNNNTLNAIYTPSAAEIASGTVFLTLTSTGNGTCNPVSDVVRITYAPSPVANAGSDQTVCANNASVSLSALVNFCAGGQWSNGLGTFTPNSTSLNTTYTPTAGEIASNSIQLILTTTGNGACIAAKDTLTISFTSAPIANAGNSLTSCSNNPNVTLNGSFAVAGGGIWSGGSGSFTSGNTVMNSAYIPSATEINTGSVTLTLTTTGNGSCLPVTDSVIVTINAAPLVNAGSDQVICVSNLNVSLGGSVAGITNTGSWRTTGTGYFIPSNTALNATYRCSSADSAAGFVYIILASTNNGACYEVVDTMRININPAGTANAGNNSTVCANNASVNLNGTVGGVSSGTWSTTGTGSFVPNVNTLNAVYVPSAADKAQGNITLILTAASCNNAKDSITITITPSPVADAGTDITQCSSNKTFQLNGSISGGTSTGLWTTSGTGTFSPSNNALNAIYNASAADSIAQDITLVLATSNNGSCIAVRDTVQLKLYPVGIVNAGNNQTACSNNSTISLNGSITGGASQGEWSTSGTGIFIPSNTALNATYIPGAADLLAGSVNLTLLATNSCNSAAGTITVTFAPAPVVNAGSNQSVCANNVAVSLNGNISNATGGIWSGGGAFNPSSTAMNAIYIPSAGEIAAGQAEIILTSTGNGNCLVEDDTVTLIITPVPAVNAGTDQSVCRGSAASQLQGSVLAGSTTGSWQTSGSGSFTPNDSALNAIYNFSSADTASGQITLILTSTNNGSCVAVVDTVHITFGPSAFAYAGNDQTICSSSPVVNLSALVTGGSSTGLWSTSGNGTFNPGNSNLSTAYTLSAGDLNNGTVSLIITSTNNGACLAGVDTLVVNITPESAVNAGNNQSICASSMQVQLNGNVSGASSTGSWSSTGSGTFTPDNTVLNATYILSAGDSLNGNVNFVLTSTNTGVCSTANDTTHLSITSIAISNAGVDQTVCSNTASVNINGNISGGASSGQWSTSGSGSFVPSDSSLNAAYIPSVADLNNGTLILTLTSTGNNICPAALDNATIILQPVTVVNAGNNITVCGSTTDVPLHASVSGFSSTGHWSTSGSGAFTPDITDINASYQLSAADILAGNVMLIFTSDNNGVCGTSTDTIVITSAPLPSAAFTFVTDDDGTCNFTDQSNGAVAWHWYFDLNGGSSTQQNPVYNFTSTGDHEVTLIIMSAGGCSDTTTAIVTTTENDITEYPVEVPSGYTPNGDGLNDAIHVLGGPFKIVEFNIYNEWGNLLFSSNNEKQGWDGTYQGQAQPEGVYMYTLKGVTVKGRSISRTGSFTLLR